MNEGKNELNPFQNNLLISLKKLHSICLNNKINYSVYGGTLIGLIRHEGFIPWDFDADVVFSREDFEKFIHLVTSRYSGECQIIKEHWVWRFKLVNNSTQIDVFVFDKVPNNKFFRFLKMSSLKVLQLTYKNLIDIKNFNPFQKIIAIPIILLGKLIPLNFKHYLYKTISVGLMKNQNQKVSVYNDQFKFINNYFNRKNVLRFEQGSFENIELMYTKGYDEILRKNYGDYMKPQKS